MKNEKADVVSTPVYKIVTANQWAEAERAGRFLGAPIDHQDGFIHLSAADQVEETAARHFAGRSDLLLVAVCSERLGPALRWEPSRGGALFPHLFASLELANVLWVRPLPLADDGRHDFGDLLAAAS